MTNHPNPWPPETVDELFRLWGDGLVICEIAARLGRSTRAVECKLYKLRAQGRDLPLRRRREADIVAAAGPARPDPRARRRCLYCSQDFDSNHNGNRICDGCLDDGPFVSAVV